MDERRRRRSGSNLSRRNGLQERCGARATAWRGSHPGRRPSQDVPPWAHPRHAEGVICPGKRTVQNPASDREYKAEDADPVPIRLSLLLINDIAIAGVSGEALTNIGLRLKRESPFNRTVLVTHCNGSSGYIPDDAAYDQVSYEITATHLKRGCAEDAIVNGLVEMMNAFF